MARKIRAKRRDEKNTGSVSRSGKQQTRLSKKCSESAVLQLQKKYGNTNLQHMYESGALQAKLKIGKPGDKYEREADSVADRVMNMPEPNISRQEDKEEEIQAKPLADQITPLVQRQPEEEEPVQTKLLQRQPEDEEEVQKQPEEEEETAQAKFLQRQDEEEEEVRKQPEEEEETAQPKMLQRQAEEEEEPAQAKLLQRQEEEEEVQKQPEEEEEPVQAKFLQKQEEEEEPVQAKGSRESSPKISPSVESGINSIRGSGRPLPESCSSFFEPRFGTDFNGVRIHADSNANHLARSINAKAFTVGKDVVFGSGQYSPGTFSGRNLLAHELTHVVQQAGSLNKMMPHAKLGHKYEQKVDEPAYSKKNQEGKVARISLPSTQMGHTPQLQLRRRRPRKVALTSTALAARLRKDFPKGVIVAFYQSKGEPLAKPWSDRWAKREHAIASVGSSITPSSLAFDRAFSDKFNISKTLLKLSRALVLALTMTRLPGTPKPQIGKAPAGIRVLAFFSHGSTGRIKIGRGGINYRRAKRIISAIASTLTSDVKIILYACSTARGKREKHSWVPGTMKPGGATGLAGKMRDFLVDQGKVKAETWGHTTVGHMTKNPALRVFNAAHGKAKPGEAYAAEQVFKHTGIFAYFSLVDDITVNRGYTLPPGKVVRFVNIADNRINKHLYRSYIKASKKRYRGHWLAEAAPLYPKEVAKVIREYWDKIYWPKYKKRVANKLIKKLRLKKTAKP